MRLGVFGGSMVCAFLAGAAVVHCGTPTFVIAGDAGTDGTITKPDAGSGSTSGIGTGTGAACSFSTACVGDASCCLTADELFAFAPSTCTPGFSCAPATYRICDSAAKGSDCPSGGKVSCCAAAGSTVGVCVSESVCAEILKGSGSGTSGSSPGSGTGTGSGSSGHGSASGSGTGSESCRGPHDCPMANTTKACCSMLATGDGGACATSACGSEYTRCDTPSDCPSNEVCCIDSNDTYGVCESAGACKTLYGSNAIGRCNAGVAMSCGTSSTCTPKKCPKADVDWTVCDWSTICQAGCGVCLTGDVCCLTGDGGAACVVLATCLPDAG